MPQNLDSLIRYHTIDSCLQNNMRKWRNEDLGKACFDALDEVRFRSEKNTVSKRTIENDIRVMRSGILGYYAPIICRKGLYSYSDKNYSIKNATLSQKDIENISLAAKILGQYRGFSFIEDLSGILNKLETRIKVNQANELQHIVQFEHIPESMGTEYIHKLIDAISNKNVVELEYKRFESPEIKSHIIHPYLLKEFRNRWYLLGLNEKHRKITTYALDRITSLDLVHDIEFKTSHSFNPETYFKHTIGISYSEDEPMDVLIEVVHDFVPYLLTQPIHESQQLMEEKPGSSLFKLRLVINNELETLLAGFADFITIHSPPQLKQMLITKLQKAQKNYK
jgi:predicted DNA-binding transcriptional regulator YafY